MKERISPLQASCTVVEQDYTINKSVKCGTTKNLITFSAPFPSATLDAVNVSSEDSTCEFTLVIERADGSVITKSLQPQQPVSLEIGITVSNIKSISVQCGSGRGGRCKIFLRFTARHCLCAIP